MTDKETDVAIEAMCTLRDWHKKLDKETKKNSATFAFLSDHSRKKNYGFYLGSKEEITYALYQAMLGDKKFFNAAVQALEDVIEFKKTAKEGKEARANNKDKKKLLS